MIDFESEPWPSISSSAKDLVRRMLTQNPRRRITSAQVLGIYFFLLYIMSCNYVSSHESMLNNLLPIPCLLQANSIINFVKNVILNGI